MTQVTVTKIVEGESHLVVRLDLLSDGSGELINEVVLSPSDLSPPRLNNRPAFRIMQVWCGMVWFDVSIGFGTLQPQTVWTIARDTDVHVDFRSFGGLLDYATVPPSDENGKLWLSTNDFGLAGSQGCLVLELRKTNAS